MKANRLQIEYYITKGSDRYANPVVRGVLLASSF